MSFLTNNNAFVVVGLGYGDEGKGSVVDYLVRQHQIKLVVRFNGGPQAAHHVVTPEGIMHCFSQFGSGTLVPGVETFLTGYMLVDPLAIEAENEVLKEKGIKDGFERLIIDRACPVVTPFHKIINRMLEISRGKAKYGSCGKGVGETIKDLQCLNERTLFVKDFFNETVLRQKLDFLWRMKLDLAEQLVKAHRNNKKLLSYLEQIQRTDYVDCLVEAYCRFISEAGVRIEDEPYLIKRLNEREDVVFEGAQGVLLDVKAGFKPYITKTDTTFNNADKILFDSQKNIIKIGVLRAYATRHGAGPFVTEDTWLRKQIPDFHNTTNEWQGSLRIGWFDLVAARYALDTVGAIDCIALTNIDRLAGIDEIKVCTSYEWADKIIDDIDFLKNLTQESQGELAGLLKECKPVYLKHVGGIKKYIQFLEKKLDVPISIISLGPRATEKIKTLY